MPGGALEYDELIFGRSIKYDGGTREYYAFATQYMAPDEGYYLAYMRTSLMEECKNNLKAIEDNQANSPDYHFTPYDQTHVIDGKYFYSFRELGKDFSEDMKFATADDLSEIKYEDGDYTLVFCVQSKDAVIEYNLTAGEAVNRTVVLFSRCELEFDGSAFTPYIFEGEEGANQQYAKSLFDYVGRRIGAFGEDYALAEYLSVPTFGMQRRTVFAEISEEDGQCYVELPRSTSSGNDLLGDDVFLLDDIYGSAKQSLKEAYVKEGKTASGYIFGLYEYNKVAQILKSAD